MQVYAYFWSSHSNDDMYLGCNPKDTVLEVKPPWTTRDSHSEYTHLGLFLLSCKCLHSYIFLESLKDTLFFKYCDTLKITLHFFTHSHYSRWPLETLLEWNKSHYPLYPDSLNDSYTFCSMRGFFMSIKSSWTVYFCLYRKTNIACIKLQFQLLTLTRHKYFVMHMHPFWGMRRKKESKNLLVLSSQRFRFRPSPMATCGLEGGKSHVWSSELGSDA